jgi:hypothetical protein
VGNVKLQLGMAREILHRLEMAQDCRLLSVMEKWLKGKLKHHILALSSLERSIARLRSRIRFLKEGDTNSSFFHQHASFRKKNFIASLSFGEQLAVSHEQKQEVLFNYYDKLLGRAEAVHLEFE